MAAMLLASCAAAPNAKQASQPLPPNAPVALAVMVAPPPPAGTEFKELTGFDQKSLRRLLGAPDLRRHEATAEIWQYRSADCVLDLFLYRSSGRYRVAYAETHSRGAAAVSQSSCYAGLLARHPRLDESRL